VVRITGMAFGWIGSTMAFGEVAVADHGDAERDGFVVGQRSLEREVTMAA
jgi:hypothetical protein